jgi:hypothetical protein
LILPPLGLHSPGRQHHPNPSSPPSTYASAAEQVLSPIFLKTIHSRCVSDNKNYSRFSRTQQFSYSVLLQQHVSAHRITFLANLMTAHWAEKCWGNNELLSSTEFPLIREIKSGCFYQYTFYSVVFRVQCIP